MQKSASQQIKPFININNLNIEGNDTVLICELLRNYQESMDQSITSSVEDIQRGQPTNRGAVPSSLPIDGSAKMHRIKQIYGGGNANMQGLALPSLAAGLLTTADKIPIRNSDKKGNNSQRMEAALASS